MRTSTAPRPVLVTAHARDQFCVLYKGINVHTARVVEVNTLLFLNLEAYYTTLFFKVQIWSDVSDSNR